MNSSLCLLLFLIPCVFSSLISLKSSSYVFNFEGNIRSNTKNGITFSNVSLNNMDEFTVGFWLAPRGFLDFKNYELPFFYFGSDDDNYLAMYMEEGAVIRNGGKFGNFILTAKVNGTSYFTSSCAPPTGGSSPRWNYASISVRKDNATFLYWKTPAAAASCVLESTGFPLPLQFSDPITFIGGSTEMSKLPSFSQDKVGFSGRIDEFRIWDSYKTEQEIASLRFSSLSGRETGLVHYFRFDQSNSVTTDAVYESESYGTFLPAPFTNQFIGNERLLPSSADTSFTYYLQDVTRVLEGDSKFTFSLVVGSLSTHQLRIIAAPENGKLCDTAENATCNALGVNDTFLINTQFTFLPNRATCGSAQTALIEGFVNETPTTNNVNFTFSGIISPSLEIQQFSVPTTGGNIEIVGTSLGFTGDLAEGEYVRITSGDSYVECENPVVGVSSISCSVPAGTGAGNVEVFLCKKLVGTFVFTYEAPSISNLTRTSNTTLEIEGTNFGPSRENFDSTSVVIDNEPCVITSVTQTKITCSSSTNISEKLRFEIVVDVDGQTTTTNYGMFICPNSCQNGGECIGVADCDCQAAGFPVTDTPKLESSFTYSAVDIDVDMVVNFVVTIKHEASSTGDAKLIAASISLGNSFEIFPNVTSNGDSIAVPQTDPVVLNLPSLAVNETWVISFSAMPTQNFVFDQATTVYALAQWRRISCPFGKQFSKDQPFIVTISDNTEDTDTETSNDTRITNTNTETAPVVGSAISWKSGISSIVCLAFVLLFF